MRVTIALGVSVKLDATAGGSRVAQPCGALASARRISLSANRWPPSDQVRGQASPGYALRSHVIGHETSDGLALLPGQDEAELAAPPQHVLGGLGPLVPPQVADLGAGEVGPEPWSEIVNPVDRSEHDAHARPLGL